MNIDCITNIITIVASLGTFGAAIVAYLTLVEIKKQRIESQKPQILFNNVTRGFIDFNVIPDKVPISWTGSNEKLKNHVLFEMINAGKDIAKNFQSGYKLDINSFIELIKKNDPQNDINISYDPDWLRFSSNNNRIDKQVFISVNKGFVSKLEYLLTRSIQEKPSGFSVPEEYLILNSCLLYLSVKYNFSIYTDQIPKIYMETTYQDISGREKYIYQTIETFYFKEGEFHFSLKSISKKEYYAA